jgi:hypothetical protein
MFLISCRSLCMCTYLIIISYESILLLRKTYRIVSALKDEYAEMFCALSKKNPRKFEQTKKSARSQFSALAPGSAQGS